MNVALTLVFLGLLVFLSHLFTSIYTKKRIPDVLLLIIIGLIIGPVLHLVDAERFGVGGSIFVAITLLVILFESGTSLSFEVLSSSWRYTLNLTIYGFFAAMIITAAIAMCFGMDIFTALMLGAILGGTSSAVVVPLVKNIQIGEQTRTVLILESAATDVLCIVFALAFMQAIKMGEINIGKIIGDVLSSFVLAGILGFVGAILWSNLITSIRKLQNSIFTTPAFVFVIYGIAELLGYSGAIAALVFGISMANIETVRNPFLLKLMGGQGHKLNETEQVFFGEIVFLLKTIFFVYIGISIQFNDVISLLVGLIITLALFAGRMIVARIAVPKKVSVFDKSITSMMIPKGLAAAVLASMPVAMGIEGGEFVRNVTYAVILFSITLLSIMILLVDKVNWVRVAYAKLYGRSVEDMDQHIKDIASSIFTKDFQIRGTADDDVLDSTPAKAIKKLRRKEKEAKKKEEA